METRHSRAINRLETLWTQIAANANAAPVAIVNDIDSSLPVLQPFQYVENTLTGRRSPVVDAVNVQLSQSKEIPVRTRQETMHAAGSAHATTMASGWKIGSGRFVSMMPKAASLSKFLLEESSWSAFR
ncbi:hypothetical protein VKT23_014023 [Stygiomarasmius scandens]|uniref:Uncharacterized protein n=1 Tax=Marasmiellus scandens TaxID=2682957 RepID=A0ABR1IL43_9AGAR